MIISIEGILIGDTMVMKEKTRLDNSTYNILRALGKEADFMYSTVDKYIEDANKDNRSR